MSAIPNTERGWPLVTAEQMRGLDAYTIDTLGVASDTLMESAGRAVAEEVLRLRTDDAEVLIVCGSGNNGGDGLVTARHLHQLGVRVRAALIAGEAKLSADAARNLARARAVGVAIEGADWKPPRVGVIVDAIFGTGLSREVAGVAGESVDRIRSSRELGGVAIVAVDLPSGLCADTGAVLGKAVEADVTVALGLPKLGQTLEPGRSACGRISIARIGIADTAPGVVATAELWTRATAAATLPARPADGHKGRFGHVLLVAGSEGKTGAAALAAEGAARVGAGLVTIACPAGINDILEIKCTEAMTAPVPDTSDRSLSANALEAVLELARSRSVVGMGPGVGRSDDSQKLMMGLVEALEVPLVIDADGLYPFARDVERLARRKTPTVLTPHPGEAAHLLGIDTADVNRDRPSAARRLAERTGAVVALKGAATVTAHPDGRIAINPTGGPVLAAGGTGDVLLGVVTGLVGQGLDAFTATALGVYLHGAAADEVAARSGDSGALAGEIGAAVPATVARLRAEVSASENPGALVVSFPEP